MFKMDLIEIDSKDSTILIILTCSLLRSRWSRVLLTLRVLIIVIPWAFLLSLWSFHFLFSFGVIILAHEIVHVVVVFLVNDIKTLLLIERMWLIKRIFITAYLSSVICNVFLWLTLLFCDRFLHLRFFFLSFDVWVSINFYTKL